MVLLTAWEEQDLAQRARAGERAARNELVSRNTGLVVSIAKRYLGQGVDLGDLIADGYVGLLRAADRYTPGRARFSTYATWWITQAVRRAPRNERLIHVPIYVQNEAWHRKRGRCKDAEISMQKIQDAGREVEHFSAASDIADPASPTDDAEDARYRVGCLLSLLPPKYRRVIQERAIEGRTLDAVAQIMGLTRERVRQIEVEARRKLRSLARLMPCAF